jgi:hypothetical protein
MLELNEKEKEAWDKQGWTPEGAAHVGAKDLGEALGIPIGRAATIIAECKGGGAKADEVERALAGDSDARAAVSRIVRGMPWVVLRNGQPDLAETRALVKDLKERPAQRSTWKGLLVVQPAAISSSTAKLPRCQITGNVLDDYDGKLVDGVTGADWSGIWVERGNSRILWLAHGPRSLIPAYAVSDPARAAKELAEPEVPVQWRRLEASFAQASPVEKAAAAERLFTEPAAEAFAQPAGDNHSPVPAQVVGQTPAVMDRPALRKRLDLVPDSDIVALCLDYFPDVFREFSAGMLKTQKITLLLQMVDPGRVAAALGTTRW